MMQPPARDVGQSHTSNTFMVDSLLQTDSSHSKGTAFSTPDVSVTGVAEDEDDEMSSYMAMASSLVTGGSSDKT